MTALVEFCGAGALSLCQLVLPLPLFMEQPAGADAVPMVTPSIVTPLELLLYCLTAQEVWDMGVLDVMTGVRVELVEGRGGLM